MRWRSAVSVALAVAVPLVLIGNAVVVVVNPWLVHAEYALPGFPETAALDDGERTDFAITGLEAVQPGSDGTELLREARGPAGDAAFTEREIRHMDDVRDLIAGLLVLWALGLAVGVAAVTMLRRAGASDAARRGLWAGAIATMAAMGLAALVMAIDFELVFDGFHGVFFEGDSWRFNETYVLRQLYPDFFWGVAGAILAVLVLVQAAALALVVRGPAGGPPWRPPSRSGT